MVMNPMVNSFKKIINKNKSKNVGKYWVPVIVTTRIITFLIGDPYKPSFATITGKGDNPRYIPVPVTSP